MRELIRPGLTTVARLGLFLSLAAWFVGNGWVGTIAIPFGAGHVATGLGAHGWFAGYFRSMTSFNTRFSPSSEKYNAGAYFGEQLPREASAFISAHSNGEFLGMRSTQFNANVGRLGDAISIQHWLVVTIFAAFYTLLSWVCRKHEPEAVGDE
ncbi:hypothetical protein [Fuerstiella marisgermanici]|uniref:Uncharacterized protein n=1 Tax=Fuerstiella marisgermanici TaxID=1891926 RepID=A0A1P8WE28_9PLAN|nr:hypothetical protein [Fuerstiella marisgermanici]APZ92301.1 hypothetical protein Fuma_01911 [Fuerstiella marisgermanici]